MQTSNHGTSIVSKTNSFSKESIPTTSRAFALQLLRLCKCTACQLPIREPVTLPCGHMACLTCLLDQTRSTGYPQVPSSSHVPPRLPLTSTTVPCPVSDCPRNAIGKGVGLWKGHRAHYGTDGKSYQRGHDTPNSSSLNGFVVASHQDSNSLVVIPPQSRDSQLTKYAISKYDTQPCSIDSETSLLRCDVALAKAMEVLCKYACVGEELSSSLEAFVPGNAAVFQSMSASPPRNRRAAARRRRKSSMQSLHHQQQQQQQQQSLPISMQDAPGSRTEINERFLGVMGASEAGMEPGTVGGISAYSDSEDDYTEEYDDAFMTAAISPTFRRGGVEVFGAYAREEEEELLAFSKELHRKTSRRMTLASSDDTAVQETSMSLQDFQTELMDILECQLCYMLLFEPLTTPCGHTFCRRCFSRSLDHSTACPLCRATMPPFAFFQQHSSNQTLVKILTTEFSLESNDEDASTWGLASMYHERKAAIEKDEQDLLMCTPIFVCTLGFPQMPTILHIFEPRYRLMIRRCLESGHPRFAMVMHSQNMSSSTPGMLPFGVMLEIKTVKMLDDGRSMIETVGSDRIRVMETGSLDGYIVGRVERFEDVSSEVEEELEWASAGNFAPWQRSTSEPVAGSETAASTVIQRASHLTMEEAREANNAFNAALGIDLSGGTRSTTRAISAANAPLRYSTEDLIRVCTDFIETLRSGSAPWLMTRLNDTYGPMPELDNVAAFGYWMALAMPIDEHEKAKLLPIRSARLRLSIVVFWIEQLRQTWWFNHGCSVQ